MLWRDGYFDAGIKAVREFRAPHTFDGSKKQLSNGIIQREYKCEHIITFATRKSSVINTYAFHRYKLGNYIRDLLKLI